MWLSEDGLLRARCVARPVLGFLPRAVAFALVFAGIVLVHQLGHYYAGRNIAGIPAAEIRLVLLTFPQYVALRDDEGWAPPTEFGRYRAAYGRHDPEFEQFERFAAAGEIVQTAAVVPPAVLLGLLGFESLATWVLVLSVLATLAAVLVDAGLTWYSDGPSGDYSALWAVSRKAPPAILLGFVGTHLGAFYLFG